MAILSTVQFYVDAKLLQKSYYLMRRLSSSLIVPDLIKRQDVGSVPLLNFMCAIQLFITQYLHVPSISSTLVKLWGRGVTLILNFQFGGFL